MQNKITNKFCKYNTVNLQIFLAILPKVSRNMFIKLLKVSRNNIVIKLDFNVQATT